MSVYEAECQDCGRVYDYLRAISERNDVPDCPACGSSHVRRVIMSAPHGFVTGKFEAYRSQVDGTIIRTKRDLEEHNRRNGVVLLGDGYSEDAIKAGKVTPPKPKPDKKEIAKEVVESIKAVESGYKPNVQVHEDD